VFGERVRGGSHEALAQVGISLSVHTTQTGEGGRGDGKCPSREAQVFERARRGEGEEDRGDIQVQEA
jgi:hypothetical protein